jgi:putative transposase
MKRKNLRLTNWDYSSEGIYFITICCQNRQSYFGRVVSNKIILSEIGLIASKYWQEIPEHFNHCKLDEYIIMPNHIHGTIILDYSLRWPRHGVALQMPPNNNVGSCHGMTLKKSNPNFNQFSKPVKSSVSEIINQYKSSVKRWCNKNGFNEFQWQARFYDKILHDQNSIDQIREYIWNNPKYWTEDELYN